MSLRVLVSRLVCLAAVGAALASPARAEGNRLLPFWGQPYPYGYAWTSRPEVTPIRLAPGRVGCRPRGARGRDYGRSRRCDVVLHALD